MTHATAAIISEAIEGRRMLSFIYNGQPRLVEPLALGVHALTGNPVLGAVTVGVGSEPPAQREEVLFLVFKMREVTVCAEKVRPAMPGGWLDDTMMSSVTVRL